MQNRNSSQRKIILEIMKENYLHPTADQIFEKARKIDDHISRGTVYRNLALLSENGEILKISTPYGPDHYDCIITEHYHFCCSKCNKMYDIPSSARIEVEEAVRELESKGFSIRSSNFSLSGFCPECAE